MAGGSLGSMAHRSNKGSANIVVSVCPAQSQAPGFAGQADPYQLAPRAIVFALDQCSG